MPWGIQDVERHIKGLTSAQKKHWVEIANAVLARTGDEGMAIATASAGCRAAGAKRTTERRGRWYRNRVGAPPGK